MLNAGHVQQTTRLSGIKRTLALVALCLGIGGSAFFGVAAFTAATPAISAASHVESGGPWVSDATATPDAQSGGPWVS